MSVFRLCFKESPCPLSELLSQAGSLFLDQTWPPTGPSLHGLNHLLFQEIKLSFLTVSAKVLLSNALGEEHKVPTTANEPYELMKGKFFVLISVFYIN